MPDAAAFQRAFAAMLAAPPVDGDVALRRALAVHRNTAASAARDALFANYPVVAALVGADAFAACAVAYVAAAPPRDPRLCFYGAGFPAFLATWTPFCALPYLAPVALVEQLVVEALFAADAPILDPKALTGGGIDPDMALYRHPAARLVRLDAPAAALWQAHQPGADDAAIETIEWKSEYVLVTRPALAVEVRSVDAATNAFLSATTLGDAAGRAAAMGGDVATIFASLLTAGAFTSNHEQGETQ
ncbi:MAG: putative DNA-binding domain-containing protein [Pseudomonadota bacterium]